MSSIGSSPSGLDVDTAGKVYVAMTGNNQVWRFISTNSTFAVDTSFGIGGCIGLTNGASGTNAGAFNAPYDVAVSPDGGTISVSDSGNNYIQQFDTNGNFLVSFGAEGNAVGQLNTPKGLVYDSSGTLYIVDSGNDRVVLAEGSFIEGVTGTNGTNLGQLSGPINISTCERSFYVADTGNNRIQSFNTPEPHTPFSVDVSAVRFAVSTNLNQPDAVAAVDSPTNETFYVADTGNNRVILYTVTGDNPMPVWNSMTNLIAAGDVSGASSCFSIQSVDDYLNMFLSVGVSSASSTVGEIQTLTPGYIYDGKAEYYYSDSVDGQPITASVKFVKENGIWKILEF